MSFIDVPLDLNTNYTCPASSAEMANLAVGTVWVRTRIRSSHSEGDFNSLPPEPQQGNIEYKLKLVNPTAQRLEHLVTQMKWRLREGKRELNEMRIVVGYLLFKFC